MPFVNRFLVRTQISNPITPTPTKSLRDNKLLLNECWFYIFLYIHRRIYKRKTPPPWRFCSCRYAFFCSSCCAHTEITSICNAEHMRICCSNVPLLLFFLAFEKLSIFNSTSTDRGIHFIYGKFPFSVAFDVDKQEKRKTSAMIVLLLCTSGWKSMQLQFVQRLNDRVWEFQKKGMERML